MKRIRKIIRVKDRPIDGRHPHMSISRAHYMKGLVKLREKAKKEKKKLLTDDGIEDYT